MSGIGRRFFMGVKLIGDSVLSKLEKKFKTTGPCRSKVSQLVISFAEIDYNGWVYEK